MKRYYCFALSYFQDGKPHVMRVLAEDFVDYRDTIRKWLISRGAEIFEEWDARCGRALYQRIAAL